VLVELPDTEAPSAATGTIMMVLGVMRPAT